MKNSSLVRRRAFLGIAAAVGAWPFLRPGASLFSAPSAPSAADAHLESRPVAAPSGPVTIGEHPLGLGPDRDGLVYIPKSYDPSRPAPLAVMLHGAGRRAQNMSFGYPLAEELGVILIAPDSRDATWDSIQGDTGPDIEFIDAALKSVFARVRVNPNKVAMMGFSDGASYALSLGLANGDFFTHVVAFSPGFIPRNPRRGKPRIFESHGTQDRVLPIDRTSHVIVPGLKAEGYDVLYREFDGPHRVLPEIAREAFEWFAK